MATWYVVVLEN